MELDVIKISVPRYETTSFPPPVTQRYPRTHSLPFLLSFSLSPLLSLLASRGRPAPSEHQLGNNVVINVIIELIKSFILGIPCLAAKTLSQRALTKRRGAEAPEVR